MTAAGLMLKYNKDFYVKNSVVLHRASACSEFKIFIVSIELQVIFIVGLQIINKPVSQSVRFSHLYYVLQTMPMQSDDRNERRDSTYL